MISPNERVYLADSKVSVRKKLGLEDKQNDWSFYKFEVEHSFPSSRYMTDEFSLSVFAGMSIASSFPLTRKVIGKSLKDRCFQLLK